MLDLSVSLCSAARLLKSGSTLSHAPGPEWTKHTHTLSLLLSVPPHSLLLPPTSLSLSLSSPPLSLSLSLSPSCSLSPPIPPFPPPSPSLSLSHPLLSHSPSLHLSQC